MSSTLRVQTIADVAGLRELIRASREAKGALADLNDEAGVPKGATGVRGTASGVPAAPRPVIPTAPGAGSGGGGNPMISMPPPPTKQQQWAAKRDEMREWHDSYNKEHGLGAYKTQPEPSNNGSGWSPRGALNAGGSFLQRTASTAIGVGLGNSVQGFLFASAQTYFEVSKIVGHLGARFRAAGDDAKYFAGNLGFTIAQSAGFADAYGKESNSFHGGNYQMALGAARTAGADPGQMAGFVGKMGRMQGNSSFDQNQLASVFGLSARLGMGKGRFEEMLHTYGGLASEEYRITGRAGAGARYGLALSETAFGAGDPRSQGSDAGGFADRMQGVMTGGGAVKTYLMRQMGFGQPGGIGYIDMRKRLEAGIFDPKNVASLFGGMQREGLGTNGQFRALEGISNGKLTAVEMESLVKTLGTKEGLEKYMRLTDPGAAAADREAYLAGMSPGDRAAFEKTGFVGTGMRTVTLGESQDVGMESMKLAVGRPMAESMSNMQGAAMATIAGLTSLFGASPGALLVRATEGIETMAESWAKVMPVTGGAIRADPGAAALGALTALPAEMNKYNVGQYGIVGGAILSGAASINDGATTRLASEMGSE